MTATTREIIEIIEGIAPPGLAEKWDNCGLQLGDHGGRVDKLLVALDPLPEVLEEAAASGAQMLLTHHPLFFSPIRSLDLIGPIGRAVQIAIKHDIAIYAAHTSFDSANPGVSDYLAGAIGLINVAPLETNAPEGDTGLGRVGALDPPATVAEVAARLKAVTGVERVKLVGDMESIVSRVAVCGGSGMSLLKGALASGATLYVTGDMKYHEALEAAGTGLAVLDIGHFASENIAIPGLAKVLAERLSGRVEVILSRVQREPWTYL